MKVLTKETGGEIFDATSGISITTALTSAVDRLKLRYTLSYAAAPVASRSSKGGYHRIEVQLVSRFGKPDTDYTIHSRSGYYDPRKNRRPRPHGPEALSEVEDSRYKQGDRVQIARPKTSWRSRSRFTITLITDQY